MLIVVRLKDSSPSISIACRGPVLRWRSWIAARLRELPQVERVSVESSREPAAAGETWEFQIGDSPQGPTLIREIARGDGTFTVALRRVGSPAGCALQSGTFKVHHSYRRTLDRALRICAGWPAKQLRLRALGACEGTARGRPPADACARSVTLLEWVASPPAWRDGGSRPRSSTPSWVRRGTWGWSIRRSAQNRSCRRSAGSRPIRRTSSQIP